MNDFEYENFEYTITREALRAETPTAQRESATEGQAASTPIPKWRIEKFNPLKDDEAATWGIKEGETWIVIDLMMGEANRIADRYNQAVNNHSRLVETLKKIEAIGMHLTISCARLDKFEPQCSRCIARQVLKDLGETPQPH